MFRALLAFLLLATTFYFLFTNLSILKDVKLWKVVGLAALSSAVATVFMTAFVFLFN
jgi:hypothetical protein